MNIKSSKLNSYMRLLSYLKPYWKLLLVSVFFMLLVSGSNLVVPWIIKDVIDKVLNDKTAQNRLCYDAVCEYLSGTGLLYAGVE